jgi:hypothetical protein
VGNSTTTNPAAAYDNDVTSEAAVVANWWTTTAPGPVFTYHASSGACIWGGFPAITTTSALTLHVVASAQVGTSTGFGLVIKVKIGSGSPTTLQSFSGTTSEADYTMTIPSGTDLSTVTVEGDATITPDTSPGSGAVALLGFEIYIQ